MSELEHLLPVQNMCGEIPNWVPEKKAVYWSDFDGRKFYRYYPGTGKYECDDLVLMIGGWGRRKQGGWITSTEKGIAFWDEDTLEFEILADPEKDNDNITYGDGAVDRDGRFLVGTMDFVTFDAPNSTLYSYYPDGILKKLDDGFALSNGIGFSPDGTVLYFTDMFHRRIVAYDYNRSTGHVSGKRTFTVIPEEKGYPDGLIVDSCGYVWSCHWGGSLITRYTPDGGIDRTVELPVPNVACCAFCGEDLTDLYITTAWKGLSGQGRKDYPLSGDVFRLKTDIQGLLEPKFAG